MPRTSAREHQGAFDLLDGLGDLDAARAGFGAVEGGAAAPDSVDLVEDLETFGGALVAAVEDEPVGVDDRRRPEVAALVPEHRATGRAAGTQDALGGVVVAGPVGRALDAFAGGGVSAGDQVGLDRAIGVEEGLHIDHEILLDGQAPNRFDGDGQRFGLRR